MNQDNTDRANPTWPSSDGDSAVPQWTSPGGQQSAGFTSPSAPPPQGAQPPPPPSGAPTAGTHTYAAPTNAGYQYYKPGIIALRPLNFGEILDGSIKAIRHNPKVLVGLNALVVLIATVALFGLGYGYFAGLFTFDPTTDAEFINAGDLVSFYAGAFVSSLILTFVTALTSVSVGRSVLGKVAQPGDAFRAALKRFPVVLGITLLMSLGMTVIMVVIIAAIVIAAMLNPVVGIIVAFLMIVAMIVGVVWASVKLSIAVPAAVLENLGPIQALARSWRLTQGRFWMIFAVILVAGIITSVIQQVVSVPVFFVLPLLGSSDPESISGLFIVVTAITTYVGMLIATVYLAGVTAVIYTDQRMRREGFDLVLARAAQEQ